MEYVPGQALGGTDGALTLGRVRPQAYALAALHVADAALERNVASELGPGSFVQGCRAKRSEQKRIRERGADDRAAHVLQDVKRRDVEQGTKALLELEERGNERLEPIQAHPLPERQQQLVQQRAGLGPPKAICIEEWKARLR